MTKDELKEEFDDKEFCPNETLQENMDEAFDWYYSKLQEAQTEARMETLEEVEKELGELPLYQLPPGMIQVYGIDKKGMKYAGMAINPTDLTNAITKMKEGI
jgi:hypothetical protein